MTDTCKDSGMPKIGCVNHDCDQCKANPERFNNWTDLPNIQHHIELLEARVDGMRRLLDNAAVHEAMVGELEQENRLMRARNERLEAEAQCMRDNFDALKRQYINHMETSVPMVMVMPVQGMA